MKRNITDIVNKYRQIIPLFLLTILTLFTLVTFIQGTFLDNYENKFDLTYKHYLGFTTLIINYLTYIYARKYFKIVFGITLLIGLFNLINFNSYEIYASIRIGSLKLIFQPFILFILLLTYLLNRKEINKLVKDFFGPTPEETIQIQEKNEKETIQKFMDKYQSFSNEQLENILTDKRYVSEALEASKRILEQRKNT